MRRIPENACAAGSKADHLLGQFRPPGGLFVLFLGSSKGRRECFINRLDRDYIPFFPIKHQEA